MQRQERSIGARIRAYIQHHSPPNTVSYIAYRLINYGFMISVFEVSVLLVEDLDRNLAADWRGYWGFLSYDQLRVFGRSDPSLLLDDEFLDQASERGDRCYGYVEDGTLGAYAWYSTIPTPLQDGLVVTFHRDYIYMYKAFTAPAFRGRRLYGIGVTRAFQALIREGSHKGLVSYIQVHNQPSLKALRRIVCKPIGTVVASGMRRPYLSYSSAGCRAISRVEVVSRPS